MTARIAVAGWFGSDNLGDELILRALTRGLRARGAEPVVVSIDPAGTGRDHGVEALRHRSPVDSPALARSLRSADGLVVAGGIVQAETSAWNLPFHASRLRAARPAVGRSAAVGLGVGRAPGRIGPALARVALGRLGAIVVRDHDSARRLARWGLPDAAVGADPALSLEVPPLSLEAPPLSLEAPRAAPDDTMAVILRPPNRRGPGTAGAKARGWDRPGPRRRQWIDEMARSLDAAAAASGLAVRLIAFQPSRDDAVHRAVADRLRAPAELVVGSLDSVLAEVARSRLVVTMRYHGAVAALLGDRPAVLVDYSPKMSALAAEGGGWAPLVDPDGLDPARLATAAADALADPDRVGATRTDLTARLSVNDAALDRLLDGLP